METSIAFVQRMGRSGVLYCNQGQCITIFTKVAVQLNIVYYKQNARCLKMLTVSYPQNVGASFVYWGSLFHKMSQQISTRIGW